MHYATLLLSKIIDNNDAKALVRYNVTESDMPTEVERRAFRFIDDYSQANRGQAPSYATVVAEVEGFDYIPQVSDSYDYLTRQIKSHTAKREISRLFEAGGIEDKFHDLSGADFIDWLTEQAEEIKRQTDIRDKVGTDVKRDTDKFMAEYERRKAGESFRVWRSKFSSIGEYVSSNLYTVYGESGRGKSVITLEDAIYAAKQGANVLIWTLEMAAYEVLVRIYTSLSGDEGVTTANVNGVDLSAGFDSKDIRLGKLTDEFEAGFRTFLTYVHEIIPGNITIKAIDDEAFIDRSLRALEADIETTKADFVVIDPFYYLQYEKNTSKTTGGDASNTSMKLRALAGRTDTTIIAITQATVKKEEHDEEGTRELQLPSRDDVKKTTQLLEDAYLLIGVDTDYKQGRGLVGVSKGRDGNEGLISEIVYLPQVGIVKESEVSTDQFNF